MPRKAAPKPEKKKPAKTESKKPAKQGGIDAALAKLRDGNSEAALELLVDAWAGAPSERLAELIAALSIDARTPAPANLRGKTAAARAAWDEHAANPSAADMPMLLESLTDASSGDAAGRLAVVEEWMPDPRVDAAFVAILEAVPYRATSTKPFWTKLFALMTEIRDPRQRARIAAITFEGVAATMAEWLKMKRDKLVAALPEPSAALVAAEPIFDELAAVIGGKRAEGAADRESVEHLFRAVYETPTDDGLRVVLADALIERNDPRGELINVQLSLVSDPDDRALRAREKELIDAHGRGWLGELAPILMAEFRFERGFLAACKIDNAKLDRVRKLVGNPLWATVAELEGSALIALDPVMRSLRSLTFNQGNARRHEGLPDAWRDLLVDTPRAIEELRYENIQSERTWLDTVEGRRRVEISDQTEVDALCTCVALPKLRRLAIRDSPVLYIGKLVNAPVLDRLERIAFVYDRNNRFDQQRASPIVDFVSLLQQARVPAVAFTIGSYHETELQLERGAAGYESGRLVLGPTMKSNWSHQLVDEAIRILDMLPKTLKRLRIAPTRFTETQQVARLRAAATQMNLEIVD
jgi:uncharacterized protein (TIGR02996 family)